MAFKLTKYILALGNKSPVIKIILEERGRYRAYGVFTAVTPDEIKQKVKDAVEKRNVSLVISSFDIEKVSSLGLVKLLKKYNIPVIGYHGEQHKNSSEMAEYKKVCDFVINYGSENDKFPESKLIKKVEQLT